MNDNIDWRNIRTINHTQQDGFEELVCQIARKEKENHYKRFVQLGLKDRGLECYWELTDDTIIVGKLNISLIHLQAHNGDKLEIRLKVHLKHMVKD